MREWPRPDATLVRSVRRGVVTPFQVNAGFVVGAAAILNLQRRSAALWGAMSRPLHSGTLSKQVGIFVLLLPPSRAFCVRVAAP